MYDKIPTYDPDKLLNAITKAQTSLRTILRDNTLELIVIQNCNEHPDVKKASTQGWKNDDPANWNLYFNTISHQTGNFMVALQQKGKLAGLCLLDTIGMTTKAERLRIHAIERNQAHDDLKGFCITAFCQVALDVAQSQNIGRISVLQPQRNTRASYERLGFTRFNHNEFDLEIGADTTINWDATFAHTSPKLEPVAP